MIASKIRMCGIAKSYPVSNEPRVPRRFSVTMGPRMEMAYPPVERRASFVRILWCIFPQVAIARVAIRRAGT